MTPQPPTNSDSPPPSSQALFMQHVAKLTKTRLEPSQTSAPAQPTGDNSPAAVSFEAPDTSIVVLDRSSLALRSLDNVLGVLDELGQAGVMPWQVRLWGHTPHEGHFLVLLINPKAHRAHYRCGDDFTDLLDEVAPMVRDFLAKTRGSPGNDRVAWSPMLSDAMGMVFMRWLREKKSTPQSA